ncbi:MAG: 30S ribosomal protein S4 [Rickettsiales bacterium]|nr:30S ribosomal protein S4 [Rickettsiales bacterium]
MTKIIKSKYKISRRLGVSLWGDAKDAYHKRNYPPGQHGLVGQKKKTVHGVQLNAKQKLRGYYNLSEKQFYNYYVAARKQKKNTNEALIELLERRLDVIIYRFNIAPTIFSARQLVSHKHILVNGKIVNIPRYSVKENDIIELKKESHQISLCAEATQKMEREVPTYLNFDSKQKKGSLVTSPLFADVPFPSLMEPHLVIEFYSK